MDNILRTEVTLSESGFLFDHNSGLTYTLNATGQFIFRHVQSGKSATEILSELMCEYDVEETTAARDLDDFFRQLREMEITD